MATKTVTHGGSSATAAVSVTYDTTIIMTVSILRAALEHILRAAAASGMAP